MLLDSLNPNTLNETYTRYVDQLHQLDVERGQYKQLLEGKLDPIQRKMMEGRQEKLSREAHLRRAYLDMLHDVRYTNDQDTIWQRSLQVA